MIEREKLVSMVQDLKDGKEDAATVIYETFHRSVYYHILKLVNNDSELAADLTQDTFIYVLEKIHTLEEPAAFVVWINKIASSKCKDYSIKRKELLVDEYEDGYTIFDQVEEIREEFIPGEALDKEDLKQIILNILNGLPAEQREAIILRYFNEISVKEIADIQGVSEGTVKSRLNYGRKALKDAVETYEKKNDIKLHCTGIIPLLLWFFRSYRVSNGLSITGAAASAVFTTASATEASTTTAATTSAVTTSATKAGATATVKAAGKTAVTKVIAGVTAATVAVGGVAVGVGLLEKGDLEYTPINNTNLLEVSGIGDFTGTEIVIPSEVDGMLVVSIGDYAFEECTEIVSIEIPNTVTYIGEYAFANCVSITEIIIPEGVEVIEEGTFSYCERLSNIVIPDSVKSIGENAFSYCSNIKEIDLPHGITRIEPYTFAGCVSLENLDIPQSVALIGINAFKDCYSFTEIIIPGNVKALDRGAFSNCRALKTIVLSEGVENIGNNLLWSCVSLKEVYFPSTLIEIGLYEFEGCYALETISIDERNPRYCSINNCVIDRNNRKLIQACPSSIIPDDGTVTIIGNNSFSGLYSFELLDKNELVDIIIPEGIIEIERAVFDECKAIRSVYLPKSIMYIDQEAFCDCDNITDIYYPGTIEEFKRIEGIDWSSDGYLESHHIMVNGECPRTVYVPFTCSIHCSDGSFTNR